jgi:predicted ferric reductase
VAPASLFGPSAYWYLTRGTGIVALLLLSAVMVIGILGPLRVSFAPLWPRFALDAVHRDLSLLSVVVVAVHVVVSVLDAFAPIGLLAGVIPFHSAYRSLWLGLGALAFDLMLAVCVTSIVRRRLGYGTWRAVHWLAYVSWPLAVAHGIGTGTDSNQSWALLVTFVCVVAVAVAAAARAIKTDGIPDAWRTTAVACAIAVPVGLAVLTIAGPLSANWARRAGTPVRLLTRVSNAATAGVR